MHITITSVKGTPQQTAETEKFLTDFLPRLKKFPGVLSVYNYNMHEMGQGDTIVIWENEDAVKAYWSSELIKEPAEFAKKNNVTITRESHPLYIALTR
jgi:heme-degrading monooxygenase HmoA